MQVKSIAECPKGSILQYFRPSFVLSIIEWPFYTGILNTSVSQHQPIKIPVFSKHQRFTIPAYSNYKCFQNTSVSHKTNMLKIPVFSQNHHFYNTSNFTLSVCITNPFFHNTIVFMIPLLPHKQCFIRLCLFFQNTTGSVYQFFKIPVFSKCFQNTGV